MKERRTETPFVEELPRLLAERGMSLRALAREVGVSDSHLSRVRRHAQYKTASPALMRRIAVALDLPEDYWAEVREAYVIERIKADQDLRNKLYSRLKRR
jgi:transcriptional regulator with XRE-family HTH domain